ncbi:MAG: DUF4198 domain-containing protein [Bacteroidota bacterium]|nr:DUF4198 domain-containing protein [Bacteroidota bacterium]
MKKIIILISFTILFSSHDMFLKMDHYFLEPNEESTLSIYNGTFEKSENPIARYRMNKVLITGPGFIFEPDTIQWYDEANISVLDFKTGGGGTYLAGVSTKPNTISLTADEFNEYLEHDGVLDIYKSRTENGELDKPAVEQYSKHVKAIFQVGDKLTNDYEKPMGFPIEFVPIENPGNYKIGDVVKFNLISNGKLLSGHLVYIGSDPDHDTNNHNESEGHEHDELKITTNEEGIAAFQIIHNGLWYLRTIYMVPDDGKTVDYVSNWATLTFEVR